MSSKTRRSWVVQSLHVGPLVVDGGMSACTCAGVSPLGTPCLRSEPIAAQACRHSGAGVKTMQCREEQARQILGTHVVEVEEILVGELPAQSSIHGEGRST